MLTTIVALKRVATVGFPLLLLSSLSALASNSQGALEVGFKEPPNAARPRVWWHWMNGDVTKAGIKLDLEWMHRIGIGGFQQFDVALKTPKLVSRPLVYMTPEWRKTFRYATKVADELGLEEAIAASPGWSETGGPWVTPSQAMKKVVWSETRVDGGRLFHGVLPRPPSVSGPFQSFPTFDFMEAFTGQRNNVSRVEYYSDTAVIAYRAVASDTSVSKCDPKITASAPINTNVLSDGDLIQSTLLPKAISGENAWIRYEFAEACTLRAVTLVLNDPVEAVFGSRPYFAEFEASDDGEVFRKLASIPGDDWALEHTVAFPATKARFFRLTFPASPPPLPFWGQKYDTAFYQSPRPSNALKISELVLHSEARVNRFEGKAGFALMQDADSFPTPPIDSAAVIDPKDVIDLTANMNPDGTLEWSPPPGSWVVLRFGYSLTGVHNYAAPPEATGLEVDKLSREAVREYFNTYLNQYSNAVGRFMGKRGVQYIVNDSWEVGPANWTDTMVSEFTRRRGYDLRPWLPVLAGRVIKSSEASERFLWDFRKTLGELLTESYFDQINESSHERGMGHYGESHEEGRAFIGDGMEAKRGDDIPMSAMWVQEPGVHQEQYGYDADIRESASVAHIYGQNLVAAESMSASSGAYAWSPATLKPTADKEMALGVNRIVIHTSVQQPLVDREPGLSLGPFGQWFTRNETWAEQASPWISYLSRSCYLLQQGRFVADIAYFYGENSNITAIYGDHFPDLPAGYSFDYVNADALMHWFFSAQGRLMTRSGMSYRILVLDPQVTRMSLPVLRKIRELVEAGAIVVGAKPQATPSLSDDGATFQQLVDSVWIPGTSVSAVGSGRVYTTQTVGDVLRALGVDPDFSYTKPRADTDLLFVHRKLRDRDLYYVDNRSGYGQTIDATFRIMGKKVELWHADTGRIEPASYTVVGGHTVVPLHLEPWGTVFVVFGRPSVRLAYQVPQGQEQVLRSMRGPWELSFQPRRGAPDQIILDELISWSESSSDGVKYFSGTATYTKRIHAPSDWFKPLTRFWIDLGDVKNLAEVLLNGKSLGIAWKTPYRLDMTGVLKRGDNLLEIRVTNAWVNRIIGDRQPNAAKQYALTFPRFYKADSPLQPSGLLGPVQIVRSRHGTESKN